MKICPRGEKFDDKFTASNGRNPFARGGREFRITSDRERDFFSKQNRDWVNVRMIDPRLNVAAFPKGFGARQRHAQPEIS